MRRPKISQRIKSIAFELLANNRAGMRFSELHREIRVVDPGLNANTVTTAMWNLDATAPDRVYKPAKGVFRLLEFKEVVPAESPIEAAPGLMTKVREEVFYPPFANWLKNELEEVTHAITLGGNVF